MTTITLQTVNSASMTELKSFANDNNVFIEGDKRKKATWVESITDFLIEGGAMEEVANQVDIAKGVAEDITIEELEATSVHYETILNASTVKQGGKSLTA